MSADGELPQGLERRDELPADFCPFEGCLENAAVYDLHTDEPVACVHHFDLYLERIEALAIAPELRETLPPLYGESVVPGQLALDV